MQLIAVVAVLLLKSWEPNRARIGFAKRPDRAFADPAVSRRGSREWHSADAEEQSCSRLRSHWRRRVSGLLLETAAMLAISCSFGRKSIRSRAPRRPSADVSSKTKNT